MRQFNIFVEGNDDHDLVLALLQELKSVSFDPTKKNKRPTSYLKMPVTGDTILLLATGGWTKLVESEALFRQANDSGGRNLIVFDADFDEAKYPNGGHINRLTSIKATVSIFDLNPAVFLFPQPDEDGNLETLLLRLIQPAHQQVMDCYDGYEACLSKCLDTQGQPMYYDTPSDKRRIYDYVNVLPLSPIERERHQEKGGQKIFENPAWWDLHAPAVQPLRFFLDQYIQ